MSGIFFVNWDCIVVHTRTVTTSDVLTRSTSADIIADMARFSGIMLSANITTCRCIRTSGCATGISVVDRAGGVGAKILS